MLGTPGMILSDFITVSGLANATPSHPRRDNDLVSLSALALLSPTTRLEDVFFGFYSWLDQHPTEAVLISLKWEENSGTEDSVKLQQHMYDLFQTGIAKKYWVQVNGTVSQCHKHRENVLTNLRTKLGTLGEARGKLTLIQRFDYSLLPSSASNRIGIHLDPAHWTINGPDIELVYNTEQNQAAYIGVRHSLPNLKFGR